MIMLRSLALLFCFTFSFSTFACINEMRALLSGKHVQIGGLGNEVPTGRDLKEDDTKAQYLKQLAYLDSVWKTDKKIDDYSDYGVYLIYLGRYKEAKEVYQEIESAYPERYSTAA